MTTFALSYSPHSWDGLLKYLRRKGYESELLEKAGLEEHIESKPTSVTLIRRAATRDNP